MGSGGWPPSSASSSRLFGDGRGRAVTIRAASETPTGRRCLDPVIVVIAVAKWDDTTGRAAAASGTPTRPVHSAEYWRVATQGGADQANTRLEMGDVLDPAVQATSEEEPDDELIVSLTVPRCRASESPGRAAAAS
jgi:hypothetical protein